MESSLVLEMKEEPPPPPPLVSQGLCVCTPNPDQRGYVTVSFETSAHFSLMKSLHQWSA